MPAAPKMFQWSNRDARSDYCPYNYRWTHQVSDIVDSLIVRHGAAGKNSNQVRGQLGVLGFEDKKECPFGNLKTTQHGEQTIVQVTFANINELKDHLKECEKNKIDLSRICCVNIQDQGAWRTSV